MHEIVYRVKEIVSEKAQSVSGRRIFSQGYARRSSDETGR